jgi:hypothetical protein
MICKCENTPVYVKVVISTHNLHTRIADKKNYGELMQRSDSGGSAGGSTHGSESSAIDSDYSEPSLTTDSRSPRSIASSEYL